MKENSKVINEKNYNKTKRGSKERLKRVRNGNSINPVHRKYKTIEKSDVIPLVNGEYEWNSYEIDNNILHKRRNDGHHPALVLLEYKGKILVAEITHSSKGKKLKITNPVSFDGKDSFIKRQTVVSIDGDKKIPLRISNLGRRVNDLIFSKEEKEKILKSLNNKNINKKHLKILIRI